ncbi:pyroglutamyl-peptidase I [Pseudacidovorax intermedius]|uniref:pyroglutamyl-peptidase I n=1 Tax=Pseudacidovorax intermedius TaxID=433924 RepID=UPI00034C7344|nr:pyroglutamyl-peptidase I [Pseudacidovorax intermedius]
MPRILLSGFEPFDRDTVNPSWEVARALDGWQVDGATVQAVRLPCVFGEALERLDAALAVGERPVLVIGLGLAGGRTEVTPERAALNVDDARIPDNAGRQPVDRPVVAQGPAAYFSTLPVKAIVQALRREGLPASVSNSAGTFVCNHVFYGLMHRLATQAGLQGVRGGFVHVPALPEQAARMPGMPSLGLEMQVQALRVLLQTALTVQTDLREQGGSLH